MELSKRPSVTGARVGVPSTDYVRGSEALSLLVVARHFLERLLHGQDEPHYRSVDTGLRVYRGRHEFASLLRQAGAAAEAEQVHRELVEEFPEHGTARFEPRRK